MVDNWVVVKYSMGSGFMDLVIISVLSKMVLTAGATPAVEILSFCLDDTGNAFLLPSPYYPGGVCTRHFSTFSFGGFVRAEVPTHFF
ncbi:hypothetical protein C5167_020745 [Papaver somniferum]|uniref:Uncharacterized protein n=1 Tax=Papaver somniferum TaxID=3469 RepID=A0A4Y7IX75_PAPSO|nr:hypothetical protein C5167_020745 [Papaver somniferum]